jgi:hypothetical protein
MDKNKNIIALDEKVCYNCKHRIWLIAIGFGVRCGNEKINGLPKIIPSLRHTCSEFVMTEEKNRRPFKYN